MKHSRELDYIQLSDQSKTNSITSVSPARDKYIQAQATNKKLRIEPSLRLQPDRPSCNLRGQERC